MHLYIELILLPYFELVPVSLTTNGVLKSTS